MRLSGPASHFFLGDLTPQHSTPRPLNVPMRGSHRLFQRGGLPMKGHIGLAAMLARRTVVRTGIKERVRPIQQLARFGRDPQDKLEQSFSHFSFLPFGLWAFLFRGTMRTTIHKPDDVSRMCFGISRRRPDALLATFADACRAPDNTEGMTTTGSLIPAST